MTESLDQVSEKSYLELCSLLTHTENFKLNRLYLYELLGPGVWLFYGSDTIEDLVKTEGRCAVYTPINALTMFINPKTLEFEKLVSLIKGYNPLEDVMITVVFNNGTLNCSKTFIADYRPDKE